MDSNIIQPSFEFKRRNDTAIYRYHPSTTINGSLAWKREDADLYVTIVDGFGWACINSDKTIHAIPWGVSVFDKTERPPAGEWVSKKGDKSYVYDLVYI